MRPGPISRSVGYVAIAAALGMVTACSAGALDEPVSATAPTFTAADDTAAPPCASPAGSEASMSQNWMFSPIDAPPTSIDATTTQDQAIYIPLENRSGTRCSYEAGTLSDVLEQMEFEAMEPTPTIVERLGQAQVSMEPGQWSAIVMQQPDGEKLRVVGLTPARDLYGCDASGVTSKVDVDDAATPPSEGPSDRLASGKVFITNTSNAPCVLTNDAALDELVETASVPSGAVQILKESLDSLQTNPYSPIQPGGELTLEAEWPRTADEASEGGVIRVWSQ